MSGPEETVRALLAEATARGITVATAESCTGGMVGAAITAVPGSSALYDRGFVTYSNGAKRAMLGVTQNSLDAHGAVSEAVAAEMATGALSRSDATLSVAVTGIAGPGGSDHKPEGRVCFATATRDGDTRAETVDFGALGRGAVREAAMRHALGLLLARARGQD